jgi:hypothetical protein
MTNQEGGQQEFALQRARKVKDAYEDMILAKANVVGLGIGLAQRAGKQTEEIGLVVFVTHKLPRLMLAEQDLVPREIDGVPVDVQVVGKLRAQDQ